MHPCADDGGSGGFGSWRPPAVPEHPTSPHLDAGRRAGRSPPANADPRAVAGQVPAIAQAVALESGAIGNGAAGVALAHRKHDGVAAPAEL
jgi:hypothetical protein